MNIDTIKKDDKNYHLLLKSDCYSLLFEVELCRGYLGASPAWVLHKLVVKREKPWGKGNDKVKLEDSQLFRWIVLNPEDFEQVKVAIQKLCII